MSDWITDRPPTEADGDSCGDVAVKQRPTFDGWTYFHWSFVKPGTPWRRTSYWSASEPTAPEPEPLRGAIPRRFVLVRRTIEPHTIHCHVLDAVADDGTAWWMRLDADADGDEPSWTEMLPLPARQEPEF